MSVVRTFPLTRPSYMDEYDKIEKELQKQYEVV